ncbi:hypothetical protein BDV26DRAFT_276252 [Aspergillus bertholletiae]|uniref:Uncharacterized protein n=1 Tax=Aspergillus bertholletiae TaxID=1226010 RepID=A0A5N7AR33_9EURO|nr:hypothetical protein BDV26DRAFT_276252 [Aspergillus bertholletiae]
MELDPDMTRRETWTLKVRKVCVHDIMYMPHVRSRSYYFLSGLCVCVCVCVWMYVKCFTLLSTRV